MEKGAEIATGIRRGAPIPTMTRWMMLYTVFVCWAMAAVGASLFSVVLNLKIAAQVASTDLKLVAHLAAFLQAIVVFTWAVMGPLHFIHYRSILHQAKAD